MVSRTRLKSVVTGIALYVMAGLLVGYFWMNAFTGKYGLDAQHELDIEMGTLTGDLARAKAERMHWEQQVALLRSERLDPDILDERARAQLEFVHPRDLIMRVKQN
jgi:cell division protein FtsB